MRVDSAEQPWGRLPAEVAEVLRPVLPALSDEIIEAIRQEVEAYRRPFTGSFGRAVRLGTERALTRFVDLIADPDTPDEEGARVYHGLGRGEFRQGRSLDALLAAYRLGARLAWRRFVEACEAAGQPPAVMYELGEAIFAYIDGISAESAAGYAEAQSAAAGEQERRRAEVVAMLRQRPAPEEPMVRRAAQQAGWQLPATVAAVVCDGGEPARVATRLGSDVIAVEVDGAMLALVPDPDAPGRRGQIETAMAGQSAALGPSTAWPEAARGIDWAQRAHRLMREGSLPAGGLVVADDHLVALLLHGDPEFAAELPARHLAPLEQLPARSRAKLAATLRAWLDERGRVEEVARRLDVHAQTVRYRLNQLRELFGERLDDPEERLALSLALRAAAVAEAAPAGASDAA